VFAVEESSYKIINFSQCSYIAFIVAINSNLWQNLVRNENPQLCQNFQFTLQDKIHRFLKIVKFWSYTACVGTGYCAVSKTLLFMLISL
jgi:hypothetical protein